MANGGPCRSASTLKAFVYRLRRPSLALAMSRMSAASAPPLARQLALGGRESSAPAALEGLVDSLTAPRNYGDVGISTDASAKLRSYALTVRTPPNAAPSKAKA